MFQMAHAKPPSKSSKSKFRAVTAYVILFGAFTIWFASSYNFRETAYAASSRLYCMRKVWTEGGWPMHVPQWYNASMAAGGPAFHPPYQSLWDKGGSHGSQQGEDQYAFEHYFNGLAGGSYLEVSDAVLLTRRSSWVPNNAHLRCTAPPLRTTRTIVDTSIPTHAHTSTHRLGAWMASRIQTLCSFTSTWHGMAF